MFDWNVWYWWISYFWSSDKGNGPEALQQIAVGFAVAVIVVPALRRAIKRETEHLHAKLDHVIKHHPDIPAFDDAKHGFVAKDPRSPESK